MNFDFDKELNLSKRFTMVDLDDEIVFIPSDDVGENSEVYKAIDLTSITICRWLHCGKTPREIVNHLTKLCNVEYSTIEIDIIHFIEVLLQKGFFYE